MQSKEIIENNKLIAEFMGYVYFPYDSESKDKIINGWRKPTKGNFKIPGWYIGRTHKDLIYHLDWNWLISVVQKIKALTANLDLDIFNMFLPWHEIEYVYNAVIEYIKWYNQNKA